MKRLIKAVAIGAMALGLAGCGVFDNKAEKVLGLDSPTMKEALGDLASAAKMVDQFQKLSVGEMMTAQKVSTTIMSKIKAEWVPQLNSKATELGVKEFAVTFNEDDGDGVLVLPDKESGKFSGFVQGVATADGDKADFVIRISASVANGNVSYEFKR